MRKMKERINTPKEKDYLFVPHILQENQVPYCMDSGVLLGLMRDGQLFDNEKDVDLQMWIEHEGKLRELIPVFQASGCRVTRWLYRGLVYQYRILHPQKIPVHIMIFRRYGEWAWCPAGKALGNPFRRKNPRRLYRLFSRARTYLRNRMLQSTDVSRWPWRVQRALGTWWIPAEYFERVQYHPDLEIFIPEQWDQYLQYRYGDWRTPVNSWNFWRDDGGLSHLPPEELVDLSYYQK